MNTEKQQIIDVFRKNVKGKKPDVTSQNINHDGKHGHWLETKMGLAHNADNSADMLGYEMKNETTSGKITFGDWSADEYIFLHGRGSQSNSINKNYKITRDNFFEIFGKPNSLKNNRLSWSGEPCPTYYNKISNYGQLLTISDSEDIIIKYNYSKDLRNNKDIIVPNNMKIDNLIIAKWDKNSIKSKLEKKFNQKGWFTCTKNSLGEYDKIHFGEPINYDTWINLFKNNIVFFDSGMYQGNNRPYSQWRATTSFWHSLITETYS